MTVPAAAAARCEVVDADKLPATTGGSQALCEAINAAARKHAVRVTYTVEVRVLSPSMLAAVVTLKDGRKLPEQRIAVSDSVLKRRSIERFAEAIALQVAGASS